MTRLKPGFNGYVCQNCLSHPSESFEDSPNRESQTRNKLESWLTHLAHQAESNPKPLHPCLSEFQSLIESETTIYMWMSSMFQQIPKDDPYTEDPLGRHQIRDYKHFLELLNHIITSAPAFDSFAHELGWAGLPLNVVMNWPMSTTSGKALFLNDRVNSQLRKILNVWGSFLSSRASAYVLNSEPGGWFSAEAIQAMEEEAQVGDTKNFKFAEIYECDSNRPDYGYKSWDEFFTRKLRSNVRPVDNPDDHESLNQSSRKTIVNACEAKPFRLVHKVSERDHFWLKSQPYSLIDMLGHDPLAQNFAGGTIFQALLGSLSYHRWHSPISGTIVRSFIQPGTYFARAMYEGFGDGTNMKKDQGYVSAVATRAIIIIEADERDIGLVAFIAVGLAEVSSLEITVHEQQHLYKGEELGTFHYGGSSYCLAFTPSANLEWSEACTNSDAIIPINSSIASVRKRTDS